ncbi:MAG: flagellar hook-length control protein FliK [Nitrosomonas sp.]|nr:flagellar hook-length control protein FliK [Nitrosomonas sp.]MDP1949767.1 flagellar hook-length control protein FliK [Nitrosomonas sp.]
MLTIAILPQVQSLPKHSGASDISDTPTTNQPGNEKFSDVLAREISDKTSDSKKGTATVSTEESVAAPDARGDTQQTPENSGTLLSENIPREAPIYQTISDIFMPSIGVNSVDETNPLFSPTASPVNTLPVSTLPVNTLPVNTLPEPVDSITNHQKQIPTTPLLTSNQLTQRISIQNSYSSSDPWQSFAAANSAVFDRTLPPLAEANNTFLPGIEESMKLPLSGSMQHSAFNSLTTLSSPTMSTVFAPHDINLDVQVAQPKWGGEFAQKIVWLTSQQHQVAEIRLNPAHLGPVEVMINITSEQATAQFVSPHAAVRDAIEAAMPRLREMLAENGITLGNVTVGTDSFKQQANTGQHENRSSRYSTNTTETDDGKITQTETLIASNRHNGIVNTFA